MASVHEILNFKFSIEDWQVSSKNLIHSHLIRQNEVNINKLKKIIEKVGESNIPLPPIQDIEYVFKKFKKHYNSGKLLHLEFDRKELRTLTDTFRYSTQGDGEILKSPFELQEALILLSDNWREMYLKKLIEVYMRNWNYSHKPSLKMLEDFILRKIEDYAGERQPAKFFSANNNRKYLHLNNGDVILGNELFLTNKNITEATNYISVQKSCFGYSYFSKVILRYYEKRKKDIRHFIVDLNNVLLDHGNSITNKLVISKLIIQADQPEFADLQEKVKSMAMDIDLKGVGDPEADDNWTLFDGATENEIKDINKAKTILNEWIIKAFITVFFDRIEEPRRKNYWKKYSEKVSNFKVVGPEQVKHILKKDSRISGFVDARFKVAHDNSSASAFIMRINNYVLVEYSIANFAFYALKENHYLIKDYEKRIIIKVNEFVDGSLPMLIKHKYETIIEENSEGRLFHKDGKYQNGRTLEWETLFDWWIKKYVGVHV